MLATGNLPGLTTPGEGATLLGILSCLLLFSDAKEEKCQWSMSRDTVVSHPLLGKGLPLERPLCELGVSARLPQSHLQMTETLPRKPYEPRQGGAGPFMNLVCGPEHCTIISSLGGRGRLFPASDPGIEIVSCADGQRWIYSHISPPMPKDFSGDSIDRSLQRAYRNLGSRKKCCTENGQKKLKKSQRWLKWVSALGTHTWKQAHSILACILEVQQIRRAILHQTFSLLVIYR